MVSKFRLAQAIADSSMRGIGPARVAWFLALVPGGSSTCGSAASWMTYRGNHCCGYTPTGSLETAQARVGAAVVFALETAMRASEICGLEPTRIDRVRRVAHLPMTKNGTARDVPLSSRAFAVLDQVGGRFGLTPAILDALWRKARDRAQIQDLHFHDLRASALTRMAKIFNPLELAKISGHKDLRVLLNHYYRESPADIAARL